jgi:hypothetical protein
VYFLPQLSSHTELQHGPTAGVPVSPEAVSPGAKMDQPPSKRELIRWLNSRLGTSIRRVEEVRV